MAHSCELELARAQRPRRAPLVRSCRLPGAMPGRAECCKALYTGSIPVACLSQLAGPISLSESWSTWAVRCDFSICFLLSGGPHILILAATRSLAAVTVTLFLASPLCAAINPILSAIVYARVPDQFAGPGDWPLAGDRMGRGPARRGCSSRVSGCQPLWWRSAPCTSPSPACPSSRRSGARWTRPRRRANQSTPPPANSSPEPPPRS